MSKELIVSLNGREKKIAIIEDDVVTEFYVERGDENQGIVGNIYKGRVMKVLPGMQSAFVDIGLERDAFLYVSDFLDDEDFEGAFQDERKEERRPQKIERQDRPRSSRPAPPEAPSTVEAIDADEQESEAALEALSHIEEISEEPVIEHAPDDEPVESIAVEPVAAPERESARERRHKRLQYAPSESLNEEDVTPSPVAEEETVSEAEPVTAEAPEPQEETPGRRRRRPRGKRGGRVETDETASSKGAEATPAQAGTASDLSESAKVDSDPVPTPPVEEPVKVTAPRKKALFSLAALTEGGEPMERVSDDDLAPVSKAVAQPEEMVIAKLEVAPTPDVHVGSLQPQVAESGEFERVNDDDSNSSNVKEAAPAASVEKPSSAEAATETSVEAATLDVTEDAVTSESDEAVISDPLADASAEIRGKKSRADFATRRGGRGRRRRKTGEESSSEEPETKAPAEAEEEAPESNEGFFASRTALVPRQARPVISDLLREGQEVLVQIAKEPIGQKGARITSHIVLPGRYVVYMPTVDHIGVSRKIGTDEERQRLKRTLNQLRAETGAPGGFIVRTAAGGRTTEELRDDVQYLARTWSEMRRRSDRAKAPSVVHRDLDLVQRILRDQLSSEFTAIRVDNEFEYERVLDFVNRFAPKLINRVKLYTKDTPILEEYGIQAEVDKAVKPRVWLKSGGYIVINQTEALVAIDVNTGKFVGRSNRLEDTIVKTNLEAAKEISRQIRLRDLGGIIILDFIDMEERRNRQRVMQALEQELRHDKSPSKILQFNDFGLVAITRKRVKQSLERTLCAPCSYCGGGGMVKSPQTICYELLAEARRIAKHQDHHNEVILRLNPEVAKALRTTERDIFLDIESHFNGVVTIKSDPTIHQEQFDIALI